MINYFLAKKTKERNKIELSLDEIKIAKKVLFSLFTRYGDTIINLMVIKEFLLAYPEKEYLILCPKQMQPYVEELLPDIQNIALNKRNVYDMLKTNSILKKFNADIGFNPWSNGLDSCYFLTYCKKYICYKDYNKELNINHYSITRKYLHLPEKIWTIKNLIPKNNYKNILICPQSTDKDRTITPIELQSIFTDIKQKYNNANITIATMGNYLIDEYNIFIFKKSIKSSKEFIQLVKNSDLVIGSDSGPLHISLALHKDTIAIFKTTNPEVVINANDTLKIQYL